MTTLPEVSQSGADLLKWLFLLKLDEQIERQRELQKTMDGDAYRQELAKTSPRSSGRFEYLTAEEIWHAREFEAIAEAVAYVVQYAKENQL